MSFKKHSDARLECLLDSIGDLRGEIRQLDKRIAELTPITDYQAASQGFGPKEPHPLDKLEREILIEQRERKLAHLKLDYFAEEE